MERDRLSTVLDAAGANRQVRGGSGMATSLEGLAALALAEGRPAVAAQALAAARAGRPAHALPPHWSMLPMVKDLAARIRRQLGDDAYETASAEARRWPLDEARDTTLDALGTH